MWQYWDMNHQGGLSFPEDQWVEMKRGDSFRLHCIYDTTAADQTTVGGEASDNEMCVGLIDTYPPADIQVAMSADKAAAQVGLADQVLCIANTGAQNGLSVIGGPDANVSDPMSIIKNLVGKDIPANNKGIAGIKRPAACSVSSPTPVIAPTPLIASTGYSARIHAGTVAAVGVLATALFL
jgi:hypothetical protein